MSNRTEKCSSPNWQAPQQLSRFGPRAGSGLFLPQPLQLVYAQGKALADRMSTASVGYFVFFDIIRGILCYSVGHEGRRTSVTSGRSWC